MTRPSEDNVDPIRCKLLGGPFCGACFLVPDLDKLPDEWWVSEEKQSKGIVQVARRTNRKGGERYILSAFEGGPEAFYQWHGLRRRVNTRRAQSWREGEQA